MKTEITEKPGKIMGLGDHSMHGSLFKAAGRATPTNIVRMPVDNIIIPLRERKIDQGAVDRLYNDIAANGLLQPVGLRQRESGPYEVIWGAHRVLAYKRGWEETKLLLEADEKLPVDQRDPWVMKMAAMWQSIPAVIHDVEINDDFSLLKEISENLIRSELSKDERALAETKYTHLLKKLKLVVSADEKRAVNAKNQHSNSKKEGASQTENHPQLQQMVTAAEKATKDLGVSIPSLHRSHDRVNKLASAVARDKGLMPPARVTPESAATPEAEHTIRLAELGAKHKTEAAAEGKDTRKVHPVQPSPENIVTVRIDLSDPQKVAHWFKMRIHSAEKPLTTKFLRELAVELMKAVEEIDGVEVPAFLKR